MKNILISLKKILSNQIIFNFFLLSNSQQYYFWIPSQKIFNYFSYKNYLFFVKNINIPLSHYSSFFLKPMRLMIEFF